ncbi:chloride channel protein, partial [Endobacter medicaginis]|nr:chloride channel protein [Endobacter medicaginis]
MPSRRPRIAPASYRLSPQARARLRVMRRNPLFSAREWARRVVYWVGAVLVGLIALGFAAGADQVALWRADIVAWNRYAMLAIAPAGLALSVWLTRTAFRGAQGSGIPQTIAALQMTRIETVDRVLSLRVAFGKIALTLLGLLSGGSIGREGPTVQVGASVMYGLGNLLHLPQLAARRALILAGGAAGVAAAFNTPLAGIVFAIEELSHSFEARTSGTVLTAVILAGVTTIALVGNYTYFGTAHIELPIGEAWFAVLACGIVGGLAGGAFSGLLVRASRG